MAKKVRRDDDYEDDINDAPAGPKADAYVGLAAITLALLVAAGVLFYLDAEAIGGVKSTGPTVQVTAAIPAAVPAK